MKILKNKNINNKKYILLLGHQNKSNLLIHFLRKKGFKVEMIDFSEIAKMEGLLRCSTLPLNRL